MIRSAFQGGRGLKGISRTSTQQWKLFSTASQVETRLEPQMAETLTTIGTRKLFDFEHDQYRELCRRFYADHVRALSASERIWTI